MHLVPLSIFLAVLFSFGSFKEAQACHISGAEISYRYIGDSTRNAHEYELTLRVFNTQVFCPNPNLGGFFDLCIRSSCFPETTIQVTSVPNTPSGGTPVPYQDECVEASSSGYIGVTVWEYKAVTQLPGVCTNWRFSVSTACCRITSQLQNYSNANNAGIYIEAFLNNTQGENSSPQFQTPPVKSFCTNTTFIWSQRTLEPDRDSVLYRFGTAQDGNACGPTRNLNFSPGYTQMQPLNIQPGTTIEVGNDGSFYFTTGNIIGAYVIKLIVEEYRQHPVAGFWYQIGSSQRDMLVNYVRRCRPHLANGPELDTTIAGFYPHFFPTDVRGQIGNNYPIANDDSSADPNNPSLFRYEWPAVDYTCFDSTIRLQFRGDILCNSVSPDGSEFRIAGPDSVLRPVVSAVPICRTDERTREIEIKLHSYLAKNGDYFLYIKKGQDGNTLLNACGIPMPEFFVIAIRVKDCALPVYDLKNVSVLNNDHIELSWTLDSFPPERLNGWVFHRSADSGQTYVQAGSRMHSRAGFDDVWIDYGVQNEDVNSQSFQYKISAIAGGINLDMSRQISSIFLQGNEPNDSTWPIEWNLYDGWSDPEYTIMQWDIAPNNWNPVALPQNPVLNTQLNYPLPSEPGDYALRIDARDPHTTEREYVSMSNYLYFYIPEVEEEPEKPVEELIIPNVFTPNSDGIHDFYEIKGLESYNRAHLLITNRWGNLVYENENYAQSQPWAGTDYKSGAKLPDGVYFFVLRLYGSAKGDNVRTGQLTIFGGK